MSLITTTVSSSLSLGLQKSFCLFIFIFGYSGSPLLRAGSLVAGAAATLAAVGRFLCGAFFFVVELGSKVHGLQELPCGVRSCSAGGFAALRRVKSSSTRDQTHVSCIGRQTFNHWTTREVLQKS